MNCPFCKHTKSRVTNKRETNELMRRRRECLKCKMRFTTYEKILDPEIYVIKKNGAREKFDIEKIRRGLLKAFEKRSISMEKIENLVFEIEKSIRKIGKKEIKSQKIGELIMKKIKKIDKVAYVRFASVYRDFKDIKDFKHEIKELE